MSAILLHSNLVFSLEVSSEHKMLSLYREGTHVRREGMGFVVILAFEKGNGSVNVYLPMLWWSHLGHGSFYFM
jgi:hypothetical protein